MKKKFTHNKHHFHELHCQISGGYEHFLFHVLGFSRGSDANELEHFAKWVKRNNLYHPQICWVLEFPMSAYTLLRSAGKIQNFGEMIFSMSPLVSFRNLFYFFFLRI